MCASKTLFGTVASICGYIFWIQVTSSGIVSKVYHTIDHLRY
ncbi:hypothetical protein F383_27075 [Gossypium arboreum]|uniref:Uncharacterized protein n=1 Tax=Gossypium arboreum TaxID=29729 RepID=A0A0B0P3S7_GOSAR|nr:hypothetical protein F383_27075 [Gossypium arboreum]